MANKFNRRSLFSKRLKDLSSLVHEAVNENIQKKSLPEITIFRPPGAIQENDFLEKCTRCNDCIDACPHEIIFKHFEADSKQNLTPTLSPSLEPCMLCEDLPCISACETKALVMLEHLTDVRIGKAQILIDGCLSWQEEECDICVKACPDSINALVIDSQKRVRVKEQSCTGCGQCIVPCPIGERAIEIVFKQKDI